MTNSEAIKVFLDKDTNLSTSNCDGKAYKLLSPMKECAIKALEENDKLKAEIDRLSNLAGVYIAISDRQKSEIEQLKERIEVKDNNFELYSDALEEIEQLKSELEQNSINTQETIITKPTQADKIRSMSDEELAEFLINIKSGTDLTFGEYVHFDYTIFSNTGQIINWLQSEVE